MSVDLHARGAPGRQEIAGEVLDREGEPRRVVVHRRGTRLVDARVVVLRIDEMSVEVAVEVRALQLQRAVRVETGDRLAKVLVYDDRAGERESVRRELVGDLLSGECRYRDESPRAHSARPEFDPPARIVEPKDTALRTDRRRCRHRLLERFAALEHLHDVLATGLVGDWWRGSHRYRRAARGRADEVVARAAGEEAGSDTQESQRQGGARHCS